MCVYVCMYVCMNVCMVCMYVCMHVGMYMCMYVCMYVCMYACMYVCVCVFVCEGAVMFTGVERCGNKQGFCKSCGLCMRFSDSAECSGPESRSHRKHTQEFCKVFWRMKLGSKVSRHVRALTHSRIYQKSLPGFQRFV